MKDPNAVNYFNGTWTAKGENVAKLVEYMAERRLWFAPATSSEEPAYLALYHALNAFDAAMPRPLNTRGEPERRSPSSLLDLYAPPAPNIPDPDGTERMLTALLADHGQARLPSLWRQAAAVAEQRRQYDLARQRLERARQLEANASPDLDLLRHDFAWFLRLAQQCVKELTAQRRPVPRDLLDWVMSIADHWRAVDMEDEIPCYLAAHILQLAGEHELAWGYLTTPAAVHGATAESWLEMARQQHRQGEFDLAERAFAAATSSAPANAEIVWERALNDRAAGRAEDAHALLRQLDEGACDESYQSFRIRARKLLNEGRGERLLSR